MDPRTVRRPVGGRLGPRLSSVQALCTALGVPLPAAITFPPKAGGQEPASDDLDPTTVSGVTPDS